jgi:hypothetical protein
MRRWDRHRRLLGSAVLVLVLVGAGACSNDHQAPSKTGSQATTSTVAGRSGVNAPADRTDASSSTTSSGPPGRGGATGSDGQPSTGVTAVHSASTTSTEPYTQR